MLIEPECTFLFKIGTVFLRDGGQFGKLGGVWEFWGFPKIPIKGLDLEFAISIETRPRFREGLGLDLDSMIVPMRRHNGQSTHDQAPIQT